MRKQTVMWTALPNGVRVDDAGVRYLRLSAFVSVRLETNEGPDPTLSQFPDFLVWPATPVSFSVRFNADPPIPAADMGPALRSDLWQALFTGSTPLNSFQFKDFSDRRIRSYPVRHIVSFLRDEYVRIATQFPTEFPTLQDLGLNLDSRGQLVCLGSFGRIAFPPAPRGTEPPDGRPPGPTEPPDTTPGESFPCPDEVALTQLLEGILTEQRAVPFNSAASPAMDFLQLKLFHRNRNQNRLSAAALKALQDEIIEKFDFHQMLSSLGEYPQLLRLLGLVRDLKIPFPLGVPELSTVQVIADWTPSVPDSATFMAVNVPNVPPALPERRLETRCIVNHSTFMARPRPGSDLQDGMLNIDDAGRFELVQVDQDGAAIKAMDLANNLWRALLRRTADTPSRFSVPSLRSGGLSIARVGRAPLLVTHLGGAFSRNLNLEAESDMALWADDVTRGFRVDVMDSKSGTWHSLCRRTGDYQFLTTDVTEVMEDEGVLSAAVTESSDGSSADLHLQESYFRWAGWSLVAPRPGNVITPEDKTEEPQPIQNEAPTDKNPHIQLEVNSKAVPGSLPRLRYGLDYRVRARAVDLAGNSLPFDLEGTDNSAGPETYGRFEPANQPALVKRHPITLGETLERMVLHSNYNTPAAATDPSERHIAPPKTSQLTAEEHGMFDAPDPNNSDQTVLDKAVYALVAEKDPGDFKTGGAVDPNDYQDSVTNLAFTQRFFDVDQLQLPYLPDPIAMGASFHAPSSSPLATTLGLPGTGAALFGPPPGPPVLSFYPGASWPDAKPFRLEVVEGADPPDPPKWNEAERVLTVQLPKAEVAKVLYSCFIDDTALAKLGLWQWIDKAGLATSAMKTLAISGKHWMFTPFRELTLVHAVRQPLTEPGFQKLVAIKLLGKTFATLRDTGFLVNGKSTSKITVRAHWVEPIDALDEPIWKFISGRADAFEQSVDPPDTQVLLQGKHEFGDTRYRRVDYRFIAATRFREYFPDPLPEETADVPLPDETPVLLDETGVAEGSETVQKADMSATFSRDTDYKMDYRNGTIARIATGGIGDGETVNVIWTPPVTRTSETVSRDILNSARPATPKALYIIPTFGWHTAPQDTKTAKSQIQSIRKGRGLRVYMDRPWWSSGDGELLGVVMWVPPSPNINTIPEALKPYATQWGMDPIWRSSPTKPLPKPEDFPLSKPEHRASSLTLDEVSGFAVSVAGHEVGFDEERGLWYSDIEVEAGATTYFPFVRLALARFQPKSVPDAHLSRVVLADFAQLAPDRFATLTFDLKKATLLDVSVQGLAYKSSVAGTGPSRMEVVVEGRQPGVEGDLGWVAIPDAVFPLPPAVRQIRGSPFTRWAGRVTLPAPRGSQPFRLVIREFETYLHAGALGNVPQERLTYADSLEI